MAVSFERYVALRYLLGAQGREEGRRFLRFITYVAIGGVAVGVTALLLALSIVRGFSREIESKIIGFGAHVQVESMQDAPLQQADRLEAQLRQVEGVDAVYPVITEFALLRRSAREIDGVAVWGTHALPKYLQEQLVEGSAELAGSTDELPRLVVGETLARQLGITVGDTTTVFSMRTEGQALTGQAGLLQARPRVRQFTVAGIYETDLANFDELYVFADLEKVRSLLGYGPYEVTRFDVMVTDVEQASLIVRAIEDELGFPAMARSVFEVFRGLFAWVNLQESIIPLVIGVIILVAAFNIVGILLMIILEKTREIGILSSMGAASQRIQRLFIWLGLFIGGCGTALGLLLATVLGILQERYQIIPLPAEAYYMETAPIAMNPLDFLVVASVSVLLCVLAAYVPARVASRIDPLRVIRFR